MYSIEKIKQKLIKDEKKYIVDCITKTNNLHIDLILNNYTDEGQQILKSKFEDFYNDSLNGLVEKIMDVSSLSLKKVINLITTYYIDFAQKFNYLIGKEMLKLCVSSIIDYIVCVKRIDEVLMSDCTWIESDCIFDDFLQLTDDLEKTALSNKEQAFIVMDLIRKNIMLMANIRGYESVRDLLEISTLAKNYNFSELEVLKTISNDKYKILLEKDDVKLSSLEKRQKEFLKDLNKMDKDYMEAEKMVYFHSIIKQYYFDKHQENGEFENLTQEDIDLIVISLSGIDVNERLCSIMRHILKKEINSNDKNSYHWQEKMNKKKELVNDREYKLIKKEIGKYFNLYTGMIERPLLEDEVLYCASLMLKIGEDESHIKTLFRRGIEKEKNPVARFIREYDKLKYYEERLLISNQIELMDQIVEEMFLCSNDEYRDWKNMLGIELQEVEYMLPNNYEYEMNKAREYKKK